MDIKKDEVWVIWSNEHEAFWRPDSAGYCCDIKGAGRYSFQEAFEICNGANYPSGEHGYPENPNNRIKIGSKVLHEVMCPSPEMIEFLKQS